MIYGRIIGNNMTGRLLSVVLFLFVSVYAAFGDTRISGSVRDSVTNEYLPFVNIYLKGSKAGGVTDRRGRFNFITTDGRADTVMVTSMGYDTLYVPLRPGAHNKLNMRLVPSNYQLDEVIIRPKKQKYSKKNNPAVDLIEEIRERQEIYDPRRQPRYSFNKYDKTLLSLNDFNLPEKPTNAIDRKFEFMREYVDTNDITGLPVLNLSIRERVTKELFRNDPKIHRQILEGIRSAGIDEAFDRENIQRFTDDVFREIDIFRNDVTILQNRFVSPLSAIATNFYKFYLTDTIPVNGIQCAEITFAPHNKESFGFSGRLYVSLGDSALTIRRISMHAPRDINLNYLKELYIVQDFDQDSIGNRQKTRDDMSAIFQIIPGTPSLYGRRLTLYDGFSYDPAEDYPELYESGEDYTILEPAASRDDDWWNQRRRTPLTKGEREMGSMIARMRQVPLFYWGEKVLRVLVKGYIPTGNPNKFDIGPVNTFISANTVEGARFRLGGMTTANLSPHWFARGYVAYGTRDRKFKYNAEIEYSFHEKDYHSREFPIHSLRLEHKYDLDHLGQHYLFTNPDNIFLSIKRKSDNKTTYRRLTQLTYTLEKTSGFSIEASLRHERQEGTRWVWFENGYGTVFPHFDQSALKVQLRYAPGEVFYQMASQRLPINMDAPIVILSHEFGPKQFPGNRYTLNKTSLSFQKRFWLSAFGYIDAMVKGEKIWNRVDYPALCWPNANLSYTIQPESFDLMNPMEFPLDQSVSWWITYWANGALFNRIPYFNRLKLREVVSFKGVWGSLSKKNDPELNPGLFQFPFDAFCRRMHSTPYMEISAGIDNIFTILRIDYVWRLTYRDFPNTNRGGVRVQLHFSF